MMFTYDKTTDELRVCKETTLKEQDILERKHLEKWIEDNPNILGEDLLILTSEYDKFDKTNERLDLLAIDKDGSLVVVELKRDDSGKSVELQAIKYAAYCSTLTIEEVAGLYSDYKSKRGIKLSEEQAKAEILGYIEKNEFELNDRPRIILASREFRPEVTASVMWLRTFGIDISCVKLTPYDIKDGIIAFESNILIPLPEAKQFIIKAAQKENARQERTANLSEYQRFAQEWALKGKTFKEISPLWHEYQPFAQEWALKGKSPEDIRALFREKVAADDLRREEGKETLNKPLDDSKIEG